jgi:hypothetical protein
LPLTRAPFPFPHGAPFLSSSPLNTPPAPRPTPSLGTALGPDLEGEEVEKARRGDKKRRRRREDPHLQFPVRFPLLKHQG